MKDMQEMLFEETVESKSVFDGRLLHVFEDTVRMPDGALKTREYIRHRGAACVLPLTEAGEVYLVHQFRYPFHAVLTELPAGKVDAGETHLEAAKRELKEETGLLADEWIDLGGLYTSVAYSDEYIGMFLARGLHQDEQTPDEGEFLTVEKKPLSEVIEVVMNDQIRDPKSQLAVLKTARLLGV